MPVSGLHNPFTGTQSLAPLAVLIDHIAGFANHLRRPDGHARARREPHGGCRDRDVTVRV